MIGEAILQEEAQIRRESEAKGIDKGKREINRYTEDKLRSGVRPLPSPPPAWANLYPHLFAPV